MFEVGFCVHTFPNKPFITILAIWSFSCGSRVSVQDLHSKQFTVTWYGIRGNWGGCIYDATTSTWNRMILMMIQWTLNYDTVNNLVTTFSFQKSGGKYFEVIVSTFNERSKVIETIYNLFHGHTMLQSDYNAGKVEKSEFLKIERWAHFWRLKKAFLKQSRDNFFVPKKRWKIFWNTFFDF